MSQAGFRLGDHTFLAPGEAGSLDRCEEPKRQILGAQPPTYLDGLVRESTVSSAAAKVLRKGDFCGHGEPTMTIFDLVIDGSTEVEVCVIMDKEVEEGANFPVVVARNPATNSPWFVIFKREWEERQETLVGVCKEVLDEGQVGRLDEERIVGSVSVGFEYPCDADDRDCVTWLAIDMLSKVFGRKPRCIVSAELA